MASRIDRLIRGDCVPADFTGELADRLAEGLADGDSVLLTGLADPSPLFAAAAGHPRLFRATLFHVGPPLDLISMLSQVTGDDGPKDTTLEQGFDLLTAPNAGCERIVLFVAEAHLLPHETLRYIEFALRAGPHLTVLLAGQNGLVDTLALDGFAGLRNRIAVHFVLPDAGVAHRDLPFAAPVPGASNLAPAHRMTPPRLLAAAAAAASLAVVGMMSLSPPTSPVAAILAEPGAAPSTAAVEPSPEPASAPTAPVAVAGSVAAPDTGAMPQMPDAAPLPSPAAEVEPTLAAEAPAAASAVTVDVSDVPRASVPVSTPEVTDPPPGAPSHADAAGIADAPAQSETAQAGARGPLPRPTPEPDPEVAEAPAASGLHPAISSEPPAAIPSQVNAPDPEMVAVPAGEPAARPDDAASTVVLPPTM